MTEGSFNTSPPLGRPPLSTVVLSIGAGSVAVLLLVEPGIKRSVIFFEFVGFLGLVGGYEAWHRYGSVPGGSMLASGVIFLGYASLLITSEITGTIDRLFIVPGMIGIALLGAGLIPALGAQARPFVIVGTGFIFLEILAHGIIAETSLHILLLSSVATIVAWDVADHGISLGRQIGRTGRSFSVTALHSIVTLIVGLTVSLTILLMNRLPSIEMSAAAFFFILVAGFTLTLALRGRE